MNSQAQDANGVETPHAILADAAEILPLVAERLAEFEEDEDEVLACLIGRVKAASAAPRTDSAERTAGEDVTDEMVAAGYRAYAEHEWDAGRAKRGPERDGLRIAFRAMMAARQRDATPAPSSPGVPDSVREAILQHADRLDALALAINQSEPSDIAEQLRNLLSTHSAGQSTGQGADPVETVARALYEHNNRGLRDVWAWDADGLEEEHPGTHERYERQAAAALKAIGAEETEDDLDRRIARTGARENMQLIDSIADLIGLPHDVELQVSHVREALAKPAPDSARTGHVGTVAVQIAWQHVEEVTAALGELSPSAPSEAQVERLCQAVEALNLAARPAAPEAQGAEISQAARDVLAERRRQIEAEGWTPEHDDTHSRCEMASAAACYATAPSPIRIEREWTYPDAPANWPWCRPWWRPGFYRRNLVKAAALLIAEIERWDRLPAPPSSGQGGR